jgi:hypothetical protein
MKYTEKKAISTISKLMEEHQNLPGVEFEFRLGRINGKKFDSNIGKANFEKVAAKLTTNSSWNEQQMLKTTEYSKKKSDVRQIYDDLKDTEMFMNKKRLKDVNFSVEGYTLDFRFSVSQETILKDQEPLDDCDFVREKKRTSRHHKNWKFETTQVEGGDVDPDEESPIRYEVELEVKDPTEINDTTSYRDWFAHSGILKTMDMLKMCV